jgi:hypothetical protein
VLLFDVFLVELVLVLFTVTTEETFADIFEVVVVGRVVGLEFNAAAGCIVKLGVICNMVECTIFRLWAKFEIPEKAEDIPVLPPLSGVNIASTTRSMPPYITCLPLNMAPDRVELSKLCISIPPKT